MLIKKSLVKLLLCFVAISCSSTMSDEDFRKYLADPDNGLSKSMIYKDSQYQVSLLPKKLKLGNNEKAESKELLCFEVKSVDTEGIFSLSELNFQLAVNEGEGQYAAIVFAENLGNEDRNRLIVGFSESLTEDVETISCSFIGHDRESIGVLNIGKKQLEKIKRIRG